VSNYYQTTVGKYAHLTYSVNCELGIIFFASLRTLQGEAIQNTLICVFIMYRKVGCRSLERTIIRLDTKRWCVVPTAPYALWIFFASLRDIKFDTRTIIRHFEAIFPVFEHWSDCFASSILLILAASWLAMTGFCHSLALFYTTSLA